MGRDDDRIYGNGGGYYYIGDGDGDGHGDSIGGGCGYGEHPNSGNEDVRLPRPLLKSYELRSHDEN